MINKFSTCIAGLGVTTPILVASTSVSTSTSSTSNSSSHSSEINAGTIAGGIIAGVLGGALISMLLFWHYTKRKASRLDPEMSERTNGQRMPSPPPLTGLSAPLSPPSTKTPAAPSPHPSTGTPGAPSPPPLTAASPNLMHQEYQQALPRTYVSISCHHFDSRY